MQNLLFILLLFLLNTAAAQFSISSNQHYLLKNNQPFFWLGDTAWELFHRLNREDADYYLKRRSEQAFTIIQAVVLAEVDGLHTPNAYGERPLLNDNPATPNEKYFTHVDYIIDKANAYNLNIALLPAWGDKIFKNSWGTGPEIFNEQNAAIYATWLANRYRNKTNIIWVLGGDRNPRDAKDIAVWRAMGNAIMKATNNKAIISYHPQPNEEGSAKWFAKESWFSFNMFQNGHCRDSNGYDKINTSYNLIPVRPVMDAEPIYEDHPVCFNAKDLGISSAYDVRKYAYLELLAGSFGHTYGCHDIWQMYSNEREPVNGAHLPWKEAMELPGAGQMQFVKNLFAAHNMLQRMPDQSLIQENTNAPAERIQAARGDDYVMVYTAAGKPFTMNMGRVKSDRLTASWYNPRNGESTQIGNISNKGTIKFTPTSTGYGQDWVLVLEKSN